MYESEIMSCGCVSSDSSNNSMIYELSKDKNPEQKKVIDYFLKEPGCLSKNISDDDYEKLVRSKAEEVKSQKKALSKLGVDED